MQTILTVQDLQREIERVGFLPYAGQFPISLKRFCPNEWFTGKEDDPWGWRVEIARCRNIAYGKFFKNLSGFVSSEYLPAFIALRRDGYSAQELYEDGLLSRNAMAIMRAFDAVPQWQTDQLKREVGLTGKKLNGAYESAMVELQSRMLVCICDVTRKRNRMGEYYGWPISICTTVEDRFADALSSPLPEKEEALEMLLARLQGETDAPRAELVKMLV